MSESNGISKQVIVLRTKYPDGNTGSFRTVRKGKLIAQGAHASMAFITEKIKKTWDSIEEVPSYELWAYGDYKSSATFSLSKEQQEWLESGTTKIVVYVETEQELLELHEKCNDFSLTSYLVRDAGNTEFNGVPTYTALAIGPHYEEKVNLVTSHLPLL